MQPMKKSAPSLALLFGGSRKGASDDMGDEEQSPEQTDGELYADDLLDAIRSRDPKSVYDAMLKLHEQIAEDIAEKAKGKLPDLAGDKE